jgi:hypothetical protein
VLTRTYIHIPGIDEKIERELWLQGAEDWYTLVENPQRWRISEPYLSAALQGAATSIDALEEGDHAYFATRLPVKEHWRAYDEFLTQRRLPRHRDRRRNADYRYRRLRRRGGLPIRAGR